MELGLGLGLWLGGVRVMVRVGLWLGLRWVMVMVRVGYG